MSSLNTFKWKARTYQRLLEERMYDWRNGKSPENDNVDTGILDSLKKNGFALIENFLEPNLCDELVDEVDQCFEEHKEYLWSDPHDSDHRLFGVEKLSPLIGEHFHSSDLLKRIGEQYLGYKLKNYMTLAGNLRYKENNLGSGGGWHRDSPFSHQFKAIVYLTDATLENGVYEYIPCSHRSTNVLKALNVCLKNSNHEPRDVNRRFNEEEIEKFGIQSKTFIAKKGTVILTDTHGIHRGKPISAGSRYALTNYYVGMHRVSEFDRAFQDLNIPN